MFENTLLDHHTFSRGIRPAALPSSGTKACTQKSRVQAPPWPVVACVQGHTHTHKTPKHSPSCRPSSFLAAFAFWRNSRAGT